MAPSHPNCQCNTHTNEPARFFVRRCGEWREITASEWEVGRTSFEIDVAIGQTHLWEGVTFASADRLTPTQEAV